MVNLHSGKNSRHSEICFTFSGKHKLWIPPKRLGSEADGDRGYFCFFRWMIWCYFGYRSTGQISLKLSIAAVVTLILLLLWLFRFTSDWVRVPADAYAERLAEAIDSLPGRAVAK